MLTLLLTLLVQADVGGLTPGKQYYYQWFVDDGKVPQTTIWSPIGEFRTPYPAGWCMASLLLLAVQACV